MCARAVLRAGALAPIEASAAVTVVPMLAPMTSERAWSKFTVPAWNAVMVVAIAALEESLAQLNESVGAEEAAAPDAAPTPVAEEPPAE